MELSFKSICFVEEEVGVTHASKLRSVLPHSIAIAVVVIFVALIAFRVLNPSRHRVAPRTSPSFDNREVNPSLVEAAEKGDLVGIRRLLAAGISPNAGRSDGFSEGESALSAAASNGKENAINLLLQSGADVNADNPWGGNALVSASVRGDVACVRILLDHGADPNMDDDGVTALDYAANQLESPSGIAPEKNYREIVRLLRANGGRHSILSLLLGNGW